MRPVRFSSLALLAALLIAPSACENSDTTTAPGALGTLALDAPGSVRSGQSFTIDVAAVNVGINNIHNGRVEVSLPAPLTVSSLEASPGTSATFSSGSGAGVSWTLNTLDSNSRSTLKVHATGTLPAGSAGLTLTLHAALTADGIRPGDAVADRSLQLVP